MPLDVWAGWGEVGSCRPASGVVAHLIFSASGRVGGTVVSQQGRSHKPDED